MLNVIAKTATDSSGRTECCIYQYPRKIPSLWMLQRMAEPHRGKRNFHNHESDEPSDRSRITVQWKRNSGGSRRDRAYAETERRSGWRNRDGLYRGYGEHLSERERGHADPCTGRNKPYCISRKYFYNRSPGKRREPHHQKSCVGGDES